MTDSESSDCFNETPVVMQPKQSRKKKEPERFGDVGILSEEDELNNTFERILSDDSIDEYIAEIPDKNALKRRVVHTTGRITKKKKGNNDDDHRKISWGDNFDEEFDNLNSQTNHELTVHDRETEQIPCDENDNDPSGYDADHISVTGETRECVIENSINIDTNSIKNDDYLDTTVLNGLSSSVAGNNKLLLEILARVRVIEESLMKNGSLIGANNNNISKGSSFEEFQTFMKSNRLPLQNIEDMASFEKNLFDSDFKKVSVRIYSIQFYKMIFEILFLSFITFFVFHLTDKNVIKFSWYWLNKRESDKAA